MYCWGWPMFLKRGFGLLSLLLSSAPAAPSETTSWWGDLRQSMIDLAYQVIEKLPESPIVAGLRELEGNPIADWMPFVNWFVPFRAITNILSVWATAVALYYLYQIVLRWIKVIE